MNEGKKVSYPIVDCAGNRFGQVAREVAIREK